MYPEKYNKNTFRAKKRFTHPRRNIKVKLLLHGFIPFLGEKRKLQFYLSFCIRFGLKSYFSCRHRGAGREINIFTPNIAVGLNGNKFYLNKKNVLYFGYIEYCVRVFLFFLIYYVYLFPY